MICVLLFKKLVLIEGFNRAEVDHIDHVNTQFLYVALSTSIAFVGFIIAGITGSALTLILMFGLLIITVFVLSKLNARKYKKGVAV